MLPQRAIAALLWVAAFCFATGIFLASTQLLRDVAPTEHVAVGRVTVENASKLRDYLTAGLFFLIVPPLTIAIQRAGRRVNESLRREVAGDGMKNLVSLLFVSPFFLAPFFYLTTFKWGWPLLIPLLLSQLLPRAVIVSQTTGWVRRLSGLSAFHALVVSEAFAWLLFRYIATGRRIAHIPTLFLEVVFVFLFVLLIWGAFVLVARLASFATGITFETAFRSVAIAGLPLVALPILAVIYVPGELAIIGGMLAVLIAIAVALRSERVESPETIRRIVAYVVVPLLLYCASYASLASLTQWLDLFHRGESLGPASDYLRGKVPYRDVFVLHGLLHDGQLDAWLMQLFGRELSVSTARFAILGSFASPALWYLGMAIFNSMPLAAAVMFLGVLTTIDNERIFFEIAALALLIAGARRQRALLVALSGLVSGIALFYSFDIGLYCIAGTALFFLCGGQAPRLSYLLGLAAGTTPFLIYLAVRGAIGAFFETSFIVVPRIIDAVWSLPFPDLSTTFRQNLSLRTISDFLLAEHFRYVLNPLVIAISIVVLIQRRIQKRREWLDTALLALTAFAIPTQRSALGRADFPHQYFSAFLIGPMVLILIVMLVRQAAETWRTGERAAQAFLLAAAAAMLPLFFTALWIPDILNLRLNDLIAYVPRTKRIVQDALAREVEGRVGSVSFHVDEIAPRGAPVFDFSNQPAFYFFLDRPNPTRFYQVPIMSPPDLQREAIVALERARPPVVIRRSPQDFDIFDGIDNVVRAQGVARYIDDHYSYYRTLMGVELWRRKPGARRLTADEYLRHVRVPSEKELGTAGSRSRLVFPAVGSVPGANESFWRSDLTVLNPIEQPMRLTLRYVAGEIRVDRSVTLAARGRVRWTDVVKSLFGAPDSRGVLWIEYRAARAPVVRVRTYDAARQGSGSVERPLSISDSATAHTEVDDLVVVGVPGGGEAARRVNIGVVNVGPIPATFRVVVRDGRGRDIATTDDIGIPEAESFFMDNIERELGATVDESSTIHVRMVAGTCVAYASVVDTDGDAHFFAAVPTP